MAPTVNPSGPFDFWLQSVNFFVCQKSSAGNARQGNCGGGMSGGGGGRMSGGNMGNTGERQQQNGRSSTAGER